MRKAKNKLKQSRKLSLYIVMAFVPEKAVASIKRAHMAQKKQDKETKDN